MPGKKGNMTWNSEADTRLFINVLKVHQIKLDYPALAKAMGEGVTANAITHRITKLKASAKGSAETATEEVPGSGAKKRSRPTGSSPGTKPARTPTAKTKGMESAARVSDDEEDDDEGTSAVECEEMENGAEDQDEKVKAEVENIKDESSGDGSGAEAEAQQVLDDDDVDYQPKRLKADPEVAKKEEESDD